MKRALTKDCIRERMGLGMVVMVRRILRVLFDVAVAALIVFGFLAMLHPASVLGWEMPGREVWASLAATALVVGVLLNAAERVLKRME